jgi:hypothetical protein
MIHHSASKYVVQQVNIVVQQVNIVVQQVNIVVQQVNIVIQQVNIVVRQYLLVERHIYLLNDVSFREIRFFIPPTISSAITLLKIGSMVGKQSA